MQQRFSFFSDENIAPELTGWIRKEGYLVSSIAEEHLNGISDKRIIELAFANKQIVLTHDNDFGQMIYTSDIDFYIIIYLRPGHFDGNYHIPVLQKVFENTEHFKSRTLIIGNRTTDTIKIRIKHF